MILTFSVGLVMDKVGSLSGYGFLVTIMVIAFVSYLYFSVRLDRELAACEPNDESILLSQTE